MVACAEPVTHSIVDRLVDRAAAVEAAAVEAERRGLIVVESSGARAVIRIAVPAHAEVLRTRMPRLGRQAVWRRLADLLAEMPMRRADDVLHGAWFRLQAGLPVPAGDLVAAARRALARLDLRTAERLAAAARAAGEGQAALALLAEVYLAQGRYTDAVNLVTAAAATDPEGARVPLSLVAPVAALHALLNPDDTGLGIDDGARATSGLRVLLDGRVTEAGQTSSARLEAGGSPAAVVWAATTATAAAGLLGDRARADHAAAAGGASPPPTRRSCRARRPSWMSCDAAGRGSRRGRSTTTCPGRTRSWASPGGKGWRSC